MIIITYVYNDHVKMSLDKINQNVKIDIYMYSNKFFCEWMIILPIFEDFIIQHCWEKKQQIQNGLIFA